MKQPFQNRAALMKVSGTHTTIIYWSFPQLWAAAAAAAHNAKARSSQAKPSHSNIKYIYLYFYFDMYVIRYAICYLPYTNQWTIISRLHTAGALLISWNTFSVYYYIIEHYTSVHRFNGWGFLCLFIFFSPCVYLYMNVFLSFSWHMFECVRMCTRVYDLNVSIYYYWSNLNE